MALQLQTAVLLMPGDSIIWRMSLSLSEYD